MAEDSNSSSDIADVVEEELESSENVEPCMKKGKISSENYFKFNSSTKKYKCLVKYCRSELREARNPQRKSHLYRHLREVHGITDTSKDVPSTSGLDKFLGQMSASLAKTLTFEDKMVKFIVLTNQPFTVVEQSSFHDLFPKETKWMTAVTIQRKVLKTFGTRKVELRNELKEVQGKLSLIIDGWQSPNLCEFVGIIATYIDKEWLPQYRVLDFAILEGRSTAKELTKVIAKVLEEFDIADRIHAITVDNASVMDAMLRELEASLRNKDPPVLFNPKHQHIRCLNHVLNLSCQNALTVLKNVQPVEDELRMSNEEPDISDSQEDDGKDAPDSNDDNELETNFTEESDEDESLERSQATLSPYMKIKKIVSKVRKSSTFYGEFIQMAKIVDVKPLQLIQDVSVRWNSTYLMLQRVIEMRKVIEGLIQKFAVLQAYKLSEAEWTLLGQICALLKPFYDLTQQLSQEDRPLLSLAVAVYLELFEHLNKFRKSVGSSSLLIQAVDRAEIKLSKYWAISGSCAYTLGLVLDPRTKLQWYTDVQLQGQVKVAKALVEEHWKTNYKAATEVTVSPEKNYSSTSYNLLKKQMTASKSSGTDELARYLKSSTESLEVDPLEWWKSREFEYPNLSRMAKDALGASATGTAIERKFSMGPLVITRLRSRLKPATSRAVLCLKAWLALE